MRYLMFFAVALLLCTSFGFRSKQEENAGGFSAVVYYHFSHMQDTTHPSRLWQEDFLLVFDSRNSVYASNTRLTQDSANMVKMEAAMAAGSHEVNMGVMQPATDENVHVQEDAIYVLKEFFGNKFLIREPLEKTNWRIENETRQLQGFTCQKATGICKGRRYTAWFTMDIPAAFGPWKLNGLPGLILEAYDASERIRFTCTKVVLSGTVPHHLSPALPVDASPSTHGEFTRMQKAQMEGVAANGGGAGNITIKRATVNGSEVTAPVRKPVMNFPLELTN